MFSEITIFVFLCLLNEAWPQTTSQPNIIFLLVDDLGWNDVGYHGMQDLKTPNIDDLAADSVLLNNYYVSPICTPSRAAFLSGRYPSRIGMQHYVIRSGAPWALPLSLRILPEYLNDLGYVSKLVGKWHLGFHDKLYTPTYRGFEYHFGFWSPCIDHYSHKYFMKAKLEDVDVTKCVNIGTEVEFNGHDLKENMKVINYTGQYINDVLTDKVVQLIEGHNESKPLFLYFSQATVHRGNCFAPLKSPVEYQDGLDHVTSDERKQFGGALKATDVSIGRVMQALQRKGILSNSIVVITSDNGADNRHLTQNGGSNFPLRGQKFTGFEGGVKAVGMVWSPIIKARGNKNLSSLFHITDWLPTLISAAGGYARDLPSTMDGFDFWKILGTDSAGPRSEVLLDLDRVRKVAAFRDERFKIIQGHYHQRLSRWYGEPGRKGGRNKTEPVSIVKEVLEEHYNMCLQRKNKEILTIDCGEKLNSSSLGCTTLEEVCLFDLKNDPCEYHNLASQKPEIVAAMLESLKTYKDQEVEHLFKVMDPESNPKLYNDEWVPWKDPFYENIRSNWTVKIRDNICISN